MNFIKTRALLNGSGPAVDTFKLKVPNIYNFPIKKRPRLQAWLSNFGGSNVYILEGALTLDEAQSYIENGKLDCLLSVTGNGPVEVDFPDVSVVTVFWEALNASGQTETVTIRVYDEY